MIDPTTLPDKFKCDLSNDLLREAVELPCCKKVVNDSAVRSTLMESTFTCPLCSTQDISLEALLPRPDIRKEIDLFMHELRLEHTQLDDTESSNSQVADTDTNDKITDKKLLLPAPMSILDFVKERILQRKV